MSCLIQVLVISTLISLVLQVQGPHLVQYYKASMHKGDVSISVFPS
jgi:hypothetical protein